MVSYLVALDPTFSSPLLFERFSVCQLFIERPCSFHYLVANFTVSEKYKVSDLPIQL